MDKIVNTLLLAVTLVACGLAVFACDVPGGGDGILRPAVQHDGRAGGR